LKPGVAFAAEDPASRKPVSVNAAFAIHLIAASSAYHLLYIRSANFFDEINKLRRGNIQAMVVCIEIAAPAANTANPGSRLLAKLVIEPFIDVAYTPTNLFFFCHFHPSQ
jgi:hypothetical protein